MNSYLPVRVTTADGRSVGADARAFQLDGTNQASIAAAAERIRNEFGRLDVLVDASGPTGTFSNEDGPLPW